MCVSISKCQHHAYHRLTTMEANEGTLEKNSHIIRTVHWAFLSGLLGTREDKTMDKVSCLLNIKDLVVGSELH